MNLPTLTPRLRPVIRVFVSSTFSDLRQERNALQADVFPKLEQLCQQNGFQFQAIDLRWGVSSEAGLDHRTMRICFEELRRSQEVSPEPNFLILLGNRYGWRPLPEEISVDEFKALERAAAQMATTTGKPVIAVLREWYLLDENSAVGAPSGDLERSRFRLRPFDGASGKPAREAAPLPDGSDRSPGGVYILQSRRQHLTEGKDYTQDAVWYRVQSVLWDIINRAYPPEGLAERFAKANQPNGAMSAIVRFQASATEQEIWCGALSAENAERHVLAFFREIDNRDDFAPAEVKDFFDLTDDGQFDPTAAARQTALKGAIRLRLGADAVGLIPFSRLTSQNGKVLVAASPEDTVKFCKSVEDRLLPIIERQIEQYWHPPQRPSVERTVRELEIEQQEHARIAQERGGAETFVGRADKLAAIHDYLLNDSTSPLVVHGASGCGKTALMARASAECEVRNAEPGSESLQSAIQNQKSKIVFRFLGTTPRSSDLRGLLTSLCQELRLRYPREGELPTNIKLLEVELHEQFKKVTVEQPLILFLDALDQLADTDGGRLLHWIPAGPLPAHVKIVVSCLSDRAEDDPAGQPFAELRRRQIIEKNSINLDALSEDESKTLLFDRWLGQAGRTVSPAQRTRIEQCLASSACRQPICLKLLFEEARLWRSFDTVHELGESVPAILGQLFERLGQSANHGPLLVERVLGYLAASSEGLAENEILEILFRDPEYKTALNQATIDTRHEMPPNATRIPIAIWSRLRFDLAPYLTERAATGANVLTFYHRQVSEWVHQHFANAPDQCWQPHSLLAEYFTACAKGTEPQKEWETDSVRGFAECVFHLTKAGQHEQAAGLLSSFPFLLHKLRVDLLEGVFEDYDIVRHGTPADVVKRLQIWADFFREKAHILRRGKDEWPPHRILLQLAVEHADDSPITIGAEQWLTRGHCDWLWLRRRPRLPRAQKNPCLAVLEGHTGWVYGALELADGRLLSWSADSKLRLWDSHSGTCLSVLEGHTAVVSGTLLLRSGRLLSWSSDSTLRLWDGHSRVPIAVLEGHAFLIQGALEMANGQLVSWATDHTLRLWDGQSGACLAVLEGHTDAVWGALALDAWRLLSWSEDKTLRLWDTQSGTCLAVLEGQVRQRVAGAQVLADGRLLSWGGWRDKALRLWDGQSGMCLAVLEGHTNEVLGAQALRNGRLLSWSKDKTLRLWDGKSGVCLAVMKGHTDWVSGALELTDGRLLSWTTWRDGTLRLWDGQTGACLAVLKGHFAGNVTGAIELADGRLLSWSEDKTLRLWEGQTGASLAVLEGHTSSVGGAAVLTDGRLVSWSWDHTLRLWAGQGGASLATLEGHSYVNSVLALRDGRFVSEGLSGGLRLWDGRSGRCLAELKGCAVRELADGRLMSRVTDEGTLRIWDAQTGVCLAVLRGHADSALGGALELSGGRVLAWAGDETLQLLNIHSGACLAILKGHALAVLGAMELPDGRLLTWSQDGTLRMWDGQNGACLAVLRGHVFEVDGARVLSDGRLLSWGRNGTLKLWNGTSGSCQATFDAHKGKISGVAELADGRLLSWSEDRTLRLWDRQSAACLAVFEGHTGEVRGALVLANGLLLSWSQDKTLRLWDGQSGTCLEVVAEDDAHKRHPEWLHARAEGDRSTRASLGFFLEPSGLFYPRHRNAQLRHRASPILIAAWNADSEAVARCLLPDGTAVITQDNGQVCLLKLYHGQRRVTLAEAEALLASQMRVEVTP